METSTAGAAPRATGPPVALPSPPRDGWYTTGTTPCLCNKMRRLSPDGSRRRLYLVRLVATAHGGSVVVRDREGGGASFVISMPR
jgi:hypothetical protein